MATVKLHYESGYNITFHGEIDTEIEREEWDEMSQEEKNEIITQNLYDLVEISEAAE